MSKRMIVDLDVDKTAIDTNLDKRYHFQAACIPMRARRDARKAAVQLCRVQGAGRRAHRLQQLFLLEKRMAELFEEKVRRVHGHRFRAAVHLHLCGGENQQV